VLATPYVTISRDEVGSTQDLAASELSERGRPVLVVAARQTKGRGRRGSEWWQAPRAVAASYAFADGALPVTDAFSLAVGLAVRSSIATEAGIEIALKWPNDLEIDSAKVGGILVERSDGHTVVGCGLNLWWPDAPAGIAGLLPDDPGDGLGIKISRGWVNALLARSARFDIESYRRACSTIGRDVTWEPDGSGTVVDVDERGGLVVDTPSGVTVLRSGAVTTVRPV
jgi:BirA family biotin operon repressor/biotin-[acetyl-CoA-carboxylase] ligase